MARRTTISNIWTLCLAIPVCTTLLFAGTQIPGAAASAAAGNIKSLSLEELSQIEVISPAKEPRQAMAVPMAIHVITGDEIRRSGATSIPEALRLAPGVEVARIDGNKWSIGIRGFGSRLSRSVLVLMDGRTVYTTLFAGTYWEVQDTVMEDIDRIEVIRGPGGTIWGPNAINGVINIITKPANETHGSLVSVASGNEQQGLGTFRYGGGNGLGLDYRLYAKGFTLGPERHSDPRNFDDWRGAQTGFRVDWNRRPEDRITFQGDLYRIDAGERVAAATYTPPTQRTIDANAQLSGGNILARWKRDLGDGSDLQIQAYYDRTNRSEPNVADYRNTFDIDLLHHIPLAAGQQFLWGFGIRVSPADTPAVVSGLTFTPEHGTDQLYTAFLQDEIPMFNRRVTLTVGTKILKTNYTAVDLQPSARIAWTPDDRNTLWTAYTHALRTPSRVERDLNLSSYLGPAPDGTPFFARFSANKNFASELLNGYELGYRRLLGKSLYLDLTTFFNHYHDLLSEDLAGSIFLEQSPPPAHLLLPAQFRNDLTGASTGGEIAPEWRPTSFWKLRGSYSYLHLDLKKKPGTPEIGTARIIEGSSPNHEGTAESSLDLGKKFELDLVYRYVSVLVSQGVPAYSTGDAQFSWRPHPSLEFALVGRNLMQPHHFEYQGDPGPLIGIRRSGYLRITWNR
jgi:iron complex outermembrane receptor protein